MKTNPKCRRAFFGAVERCAFAVILITIVASGATAQTNTFPSSGNVGIGTTTPQVKLEVQSAALDTSTVAFSAVTITNTNTNWYNSQLTLLDTRAVAAGVGGRMLFGGKYNGSIPTTWAAVGGYKENATNLNFAGYLSFETRPNGGSNTERMRISSTGTVGIGTTNPTSKLHVVSGTDSATTMLSLDTGVHGGTAMTVGGTVNNESTFGLSVYRAGTYTSRFGVSSAGNVYLQPGGGNVGIGTTTPNNAKLHLFSGASGATEYTAGGFPELTLESGGNTDLYFLSPNTGSARMWFGSPSSNVAGGIMYFHNATAANGYMYFVAGNNSEKMRILGNGNIGIGTSAPASKLEVAGTIHSTTGGIKFPDGTVQTTAASGVGGGPTSFSDITAGTNTVALLVSGSLGVSGTGTINATSLANAANITSGTVTTARLGSGTANNTTFLRGDNTWAAITSSQWSAAGTNNINYGASGNVGIGVGTPSSKLDVNGNINVSGTGNITATGTITGNIINAKYQDLAEWVPSSEQLSAGTVVVLDTTKSNQVVSATVAYDTRVAGVISAQPGITLGEGGEGKVLVATTGRVRVKVDASRGAIQIGDLLVTSDISGVAMKSEPLEFAGRKMHMPGTIIGKALEPMAKGKGEILVLLSLQ